MEKVFHHSFSKTVTSSGSNCSSGTTNSSGTTDFSAQNTYLSSIVTAFHTVELNYSDRSDVLNSKKLDAIELKKKSTTDALKIFDFTYTYFGPNNQKLKLDQIQEKDTSGKTIPPFVFTYNAVNLNDKNGSKMDHWVFQNNNGNLSVSNIPDDETTIFFNDYDFGNPNREADSKSLDGLMTRIDYPTGWFESFQYELNDVGNLGNYNVIGYQAKDTTLNLIHNGQPD